MSGAIRGIFAGRRGDSRIQVGGRHERTEGLNSVVKVSLNFLCDVQNGLDAPLPETSPISNIVLGTKPDTRQNLYGTVCVGNGGRAIAIFALSAEQVSGGVREGDDGRPPLCKRGRVVDVARRMRLHGGEAEGSCGGLGGWEGYR